MPERVFPPALMLRDRVLDLRGRTLVVGVVNVTPDSFSDGGAYAEPDAAVARGLELAREGADLLDIGGESTRPGAEPVSTAEELHRVLPVVRALRERVSVPLSVDTYKAEVARAAVAAGADIVNDISMLRFDPEMAATVAHLGVGVILSHSRGRDLRDLHRDPHYANPAREVGAELGNALARALQAGIEEGRIAVDPGLGFSKSAEHNLALLADLGPVLDLGRPVLVGPSRKSFLGKITGRPVDERLPGTIAAVVAAILAGAQLVRVHEVGPLLDAVRVADAIRRGASDGRLT